MAVFKIEKTKDYTVMSNYHLRDKNLSLKAKGLLSYMLSLPDDWDYSINGLVAINKESVRAIRNILSELKENNYLVVNKFKNKKGQFEYEYLIYEKPDIHFVDVDELPMDNSIQINTNKQNTNNKDKIDKNENYPFEEKHNPLTLKLIDNNYIGVNDPDILSYDDLFNELLKEYVYKDINTIVHYILNCTRFNDYKDEYGNKIYNKFGYLKNAIYSNIDQFERMEELEFCYEY